MPKPRSKYYHDSVQAPNKRRVSFKQTWGSNQRSHINMAHIGRYEDTGLDFDRFMVPGGGGASRGSRKYSSKNSHRSGSPAPRRQWMNSPTGWYRIVLPYGSKYEKAFILRKLLDNVTPLPFTPHMWTNQGKVVSFYLDENKTAEKLSNLNKEIDMGDGFKLVIRVRSEIPNVEVTASLKERMKQVMAKRYNATTKALDLSKFHEDSELDGHFCPLFKPEITLAALHIIAENIPELEAIDLSSNNIQVLSHLKGMPKKLPNLKILHIGKNKIQSMNQFNALTGMPIVELVLDGNPVCEYFLSQTIYISDCRDRFPKLQKLDGVPLPPAISFDIEEASIPPTKQTFLCNQEGQSIVRQFLEQYMLIMDSDDRQLLQHAYREDAMFSVTMANQWNKSNNAALSWYSADNRNLEQVRDVERRRKLLKHGNHTIVAFLKDMPQTKHDMNSLTVDLTLFTPQMLVLNVSGIFKELKSGGKRYPPIRHFFRTFVIVPSGPGFCIVNDELHVTNASREQQEAAFKSVSTTGTPSTSVLALSWQQPGVTATAVATGAPALTQEECILKVTEQTGMNLTWSRQCLEETNWDVERALLAFREAHTKGAIPKDAFTVVA